MQSALRVRASIPTILKQHLRSPLRVASSSSRTSGEKFFTGSPSRPYRKTCASLARPRTQRRTLTTQSQKQNVPPRSILIVNKHRTRAVAEGIEALLRYVHEKYPGVRVFHEDRPDIPEGVEVWHPGYVDDCSLSQLTWNPCCPDYPFVMGHAPPAMGYRSVFHMPARLHRSSSFTVEDSVSCLPRKVHSTLPNGCARCPAFTQ